MATNTSNDLGSATGRIILDLSSLIDASAIVASFAKQTMAAMQPIAAMLENLASISKASTATYAADLKLQAAEAKASADITVAATNQKIAADENATALLIQNSKERIAMSKDELAQAKATAQANNEVSASGTGGQTSLRVNPAGRGLISLGYAASSLGLTGIAQPALAAGAILQAESELLKIGPQFQALAVDISKLGGVLKPLGELGANVAVALGATAGGVGAAFGAILAVAAPIVVIVLAFAAALGQVSANFKAATDQAQAYVDKQTQVNALVAKGATNQDVATNVQTAQQAFDATKASLAKLDPLMALINQSGGVIKQDINNQINGSGLQQGAANLLAGFIPGMGDLNAKISAASGGTFTTATALAAAYQKLTADLQVNQTAVENQGAAVGNAGIQTNTLLKAYNDQGEAAIQDAQLVQQLSQMNSQQLRQRLDANTQEAAAIQYNGALLTGNQLDAAVARINQLDKEKAVIEEMLKAADAAQLADYIAKLKDLNDAFKLQADRTTQDRVISGLNMVQDRNIQLARAQQDQSLQTLQQADDFNKQQTRATQDFLASQTKAQAAYDVQTQQAAADQQAKLLQIMTDARLKIFEAAQQLDARAVYNDQQARDKALNDAKLSYTTQQTQRAAQFDQQKTDQQAQFDLQRQRANEDFNQTQQRQAAQRALAAQRQQEDWLKQDTRQNAQYALQDQRRAEDDAKQVLKLEDQYAQLTGVVGSGMTQVRQIFGDAMVNMIAYVQNLRSNIVNATNQAIGNIPGYAPLPSEGGGTGGGFPVWGGNYNISTPPGFSGSPFPSFDSGGINLAPGLFRSNVPEMHIPLSKMGGAGMNISVGNIVLGDIGSRSNSDVMALIESGLRQAAAKGLARIQGARQ